MKISDIEKLQIAWNCIKGLEFYPIVCPNEEQDEAETIPFNKLFKEQIDIIDKFIEEAKDDK